MAREASAAVVFLFLMPLLVNFKQICTLDAVREFYRRIAQPLVMLLDTFESLITKLINLYQKFYKLEKQNERLPISYKGMLSMYIDRMYKTLDFSRFRNMK